jgi:oligoendopeptidase F
MAKRKSISGLKPSINLIILILVLLTSIAAAQKMSLVRDSIPEQYKWDLSPIYPSWEAWEADIPKVEALIENYKSLQGTLANGPDAFLKVFKSREEMDILLRQVSAFAGLSRATDVRDSDLAARAQRRQVLRSKAKMAKTWFKPELLTLDWDQLQQWIKENPELAIYSYEIENEFRRKQHTLDEEQEKLLSYFSTFYDSPEDIYSVLTTADIKYPTIQLANGEEIVLTEGNYSNILNTNRNEQDRAHGFKSFLSLYGDNAHTHTAIYKAVLQRDWAIAQARRYKSTLESYLDEDNIPTVIYENLMETVKKGSAGVRRYFDLKKKVMQQEAHHIYDRYVPIIDFDPSYKYDDIIDWIIASVEPFGPEYQAQVRWAFDNRWIDVYENEGKYTGGFCSDVYGVHPYILVNYNETAREMFTVAHEMGHALHTVLAEENQPYATTDYPIFVAEVAAIADEQMLLHYLLEKTDDPRERIYLLQYTLDAMRATFYRQLLFADFEWRAHQLVENDQPVTAESLYDLYMNVVDDFYGESMVRDSLLGYYWSAVPHFHESPYYVYKYATSYAAATHLIGEIFSDDEIKSKDAVVRLMNLQKAGGSDYPMELLKKAGVDMSLSETYQAIIDLTNELVTQLEKELARL